MTRALLLDTHVLLWALAQPRKLSPSARSLLSDRSIDLVVSAASAWEIATKHRIGKLPGAAGVIGDLDRHLDRLGAQHLSITTAHALTAGLLDWDHRDPFDRMLAAQARLEQLSLMTIDPVFDERVELTVVPA
ncbi:MAG TPA: type II toxin-antitoxin system VapC family toxin [Microcella sp.]|nr:type II toxin-antitoxin system VapC family toxin [Microcella sp.]